MAARRKSEPVALDSAWRPVIEGALFFGAAIVAVRLWRDGAIFPSQDATWLIPLTWIVAAVIATWPLWAPSRDLFTLPQWFGASWAGSIRPVAWLSVLVLMPFAAAYLLYQGWWRGLSIVPAAPQHWGGLLFYQFVYVAFPEELFFRGYLQQRFDDVFGRPYRVFGAPCGAGLLMANLLFAAGHVLATDDVARLDVFFPGLLFGWLLARTGSLIAPMLFHGLCNLLLFTLQAWVQ
ncbi:MAG: type II CAAX endopeptidase family protein [Nitrospirota bacterium]